MKLSPKKLKNFKLLQIKFKNMYKLNVVILIKNVDNYNFKSIKLKIIKYGKHYIKLIFDQHGCNSLTIAIQ